MSFSTPVPTPFLETQFLVILHLWSTQSVSCAEDDDEVDNSHPNDSTDDLVGVAEELHLVLPVGEVGGRHVGHDQDRYQAGTVVDKGQHRTNFQKHI